jgi:hypothetical protein
LGYISRSKLIFRYFKKFYDLGRELLRQSSPSAALGRKTQRLLGKPVAFAGGLLIQNTCRNSTSFDSGKLGYTGSRRLKLNERASCISAHLTFGSTNFIQFEFSENLPGSRVQIC